MINTNANSLKNLPDLNGRFGKFGGRFVAETAGKYLITVTAGEKSISKPLVVYDRGIQREVITVGTGTVEDKHTSDFWVFEGQDGNDYAVSGTWGADRTTYFWDVTDPGNLKKIESSVGSEDYQNCKQ